MSSCGTTVETVDGEGGHECRYVGLPSTSESLECCETVIKNFGDFVVSQDDSTDRSEKCNRQLLGHQRKVL